jgi:DNA-binding response OmpR family regulator
VETRPAPADSGSFEDADALSILLVDDDERFRSTFMKRLAIDGHTVKTAGDGQAALATLDSDHWDLVCVDERLPDMPGTELAQLVRERHPACFIALVTGFAAGVDDASMRVAWIDAVLPKPTKEAELERMLTQARARRGSGRR